MQQAQHSEHDSGSQAGADVLCCAQEWDKIWTINKRIIDPVAPRHTAVTTAGRVPVTITGVCACQQPTLGRLQLYVCVCAVQVHPSCVACLFEAGLVCGKVRA